MNGRGRFAVGVAAVAAVVVSVAIAQAYRMPGDDVVALVALSVGAAGATGGLAFVLQRALRRRGVVAQALVVALAPVVGTAVGSLLAAKAMFVSGHDLSALLVVLAAAGGVGVAIGLGLADRLCSGTAELAELAGRLGDAAVGPLPRPATRELADLAERLAETSARLAESNARERALDGSRRQLVAWVSHDLRTPLSGIRAMVEALEDGIVTGDDVDRYHRSLRVEADRLAGLVDDLFELSRIESSALRLTIERVSLAEVVSDALAGATPVARAKGVRLGGTIEEPAPVVDAATAELGRVLRNLLDNAIRHTPADGAVFVEAGCDGHEAFISVADSCGGIPTDELDRVFDLAFRGDPARTPGSQGAGLGLAIARGLVEAHYGEIAVRNEAGGCRFIVRLPLPA